MERDLGLPAVSEWAEQQRKEPLWAWSFVLAFMKGAEDLFERGKRVGVWCSEETVLLGLPAFPPGALQLLHQHPSSTGIHLATVLFRAPGERAHRNVEVSPHPCHVYSLYFMVHSPDA